MAEIIRMPKMSDTMTEGTLVAWHKKVGDAVKSGDLLAEVETDKATMELESYQEGILLHIGVEKGQAVEVDGILAILGTKGEDISAIISSAGAPAKPPVQARSMAPAAATETSVPTPPAVLASPALPPVASADIAAESEDLRIKASPLARKIAEEKHLSLSTITGSGPEGRVIKKDVEAALVAGPVVVAKAIPASIALVAGAESWEDVPLSNIRKTIARRLAESMYSAPHFYLTMEINMDKAVAARPGMNEISPEKISFNDFVVKAAALALKKHPAINASWLGDRIRYNHHVHIGVAVAVEEGLLVPVIRFADQKSLSQLAAETRVLADKASHKKLSLEEMQGNTFTISNLGMFDIDEFTAIINPPDACILAVGKIAQLPRVSEGEIKIQHIMKLTLSCDHRVVDGTTGALFLKTLRSYLEDPMRMLI